MGEALHKLSAAGMVDALAQRVLAAQQSERVQQHHPQSLGQLSPPISGPLTV